MNSWIRGVGLMLCSIVLAHRSADAQQAGDTTTAPAGSSDNLDEIVVHGIRRGDLIMPTTVTSESAYGLNLGVMDTPRNNTVLSKAQLDALDVQNPGGFSSLTASAYSDASFGQPNVPRIRGQYADIFYNGMRDSFTLNGYGAPISFNMVDSIDIIKGPASVQGGAGPGCGRFHRHGHQDAVHDHVCDDRIFGGGHPSEAHFEPRCGWSAGPESGRTSELHQQRQRQLLQRHVLPPAVAVWRPAVPADIQLQNSGQRRHHRYALSGERRYQPCEPRPHQQQQLPHRRAAAQPVSRASAPKSI